MSMAKKYRNSVLTILLIIIFFIFLYWSKTNLDAYMMRILNLCAINAVLALSLNLTNGFTGLFSLGTSGFMAVGAYTSALLTMPPSVKTMNFFMQPINPILLNINVHFLFALLIAGILSAFIGFIIGAPVLKLRGDYLAIATLGFGEIISVVFTNTQTITNGALGLKGIPQYTNQYWSWGVAIVIVLGLKALLNSSYGRAFKAIREDETAAQAMGINLFNHKTLSFTISAFIAGIGGALLANLNSTIDPTMFRFFFTYQILLIVVLGGMGSITGSVISACIMTVLMEVLRVVESPMELGFISIPGISGMRMVVFSVILILVVLFLRHGIMGEKELSWDLLPGKEGGRGGNFESRQNND